MGRAATLPLVERATEAYRYERPHGANGQKDRDMWLHQTVRRAKSFHVCEATSTLVTERATTWDSHTPHHKKFPFTPGMHIMTEFFVELFASFPDLIVPVGDSDEGHVLVYTDASDSPDHSGMGIVIIDTKTNRKFISECIVPPEFLNLLRRDRDAIINHPELLAIECAFLTFGDIVRGRKVLFFGDNTSSLSLRRWFTVTQRRPNSADCPMPPSYPWLRCSATCSLLTFLQTRT